MSSGVLLERIWAPPWVMALLWGACLAAAFGLSESGSSALGWEILLVLATPILITALFGCLETRRERAALRISFGLLPLVRKRIPFDSILEARAVVYRPIRDFGGWGIRFGKGVSAWTIRGNAAVRLELEGRGAFLLGSMDARRLAAQIAERAPRAKR